MELLATTDFGVSAQVLQEFYVNAVMKAAHALTPAQALEIIARLAVRPCVDTDATLVFRAVGVSERYRISYWDAAIVAAAARLGAETLYTEDLSHGHDYEGVRAVNPFLEP